MDAQSRELDLWDKAIEKIVDAETKTLLQVFSDTREIDVKCLQGYKLAKKEDKDSGNNKSNNSLHTNVSREKYLQQSFIHQNQASKKDQDYQEDFWRHGGQKQSYIYNFSAISIKSIKKERKNIFYIEYFYSKKKGHYSKKCPWNSKKKLKN